MVQQIKRNARRTKRGKQAREEGEDERDTGVRVLMGDQGVERNRGAAKRDKSKAKGESKSRRVRRRESSEEEAGMLSVHEDLARFVQTREQDQSTRKGKGKPSKSSRRARRDASGPHLVEGGNDGSLNRSLLVRDDHHQPQLRFERPS
jgi:hypothetical protein